MNLTSSYGHESGFDPPRSWNECSAASPCSIAFRCASRFGIPEGQTVVRESQRSQEFEDKQKPGIRHPLGSMSGSWNYKGPDFQCKKRFGMKLAWSGLRSAS